MADLPRNNSGFEECSGTSHLRNDQLTLTVQASSSKSFSEVYLSENTMMTMLFWNGDSKVLLGKDGRRTACTLFTDPATNANEAVPDDKIKINSAIRNKLRVSVGDSVTILKDESIPRGRTVCVRPFEECPEDLESVNLFEAYLRPHFKDAYRPVHTGDVFHVTRNGRRIKFKITNVDPSPFCTVGPGTSIRCKSFTSSGQFELAKIESMKHVLPAPIKEEADSEPEITFLKVVPAPAPAPICSMNILPKSADGEAGIINDPPAVMHKNRRLESPFKNDLEVLSFHHQRALGLFCKGKFGESMSEFKMVFGKRTLLLGPHHVDTLKSQFFVGRCLFKQQNVSEAKKILKRVLKIQTLVLPADDGNIEETEFAVARCLEGLEKYRKAEKIYRMLYDKTNKRLGPSHKNTLITQYNLANALDKQNKLDDAMKFYGAFVDLGVQCLGPGNESVVHAQGRIKCLENSK